MILVGNSGFIFTAIAVKRNLRGSTRHKLLQQKQEKLYSRSRNQRLNLSLEVKMEAAKRPVAWRQDRIYVPIPCRQPLRHPPQTHQELQSPPYLAQPTRQQRLESQRPSKPVQVSSWYRLPPYPSWEPSCPALRAGQLQHSQSPRSMPLES